MRGSIIFRVLGVLLLLGVLIAAGVFIFQAGQAQGYALGLAAADKGTLTQPPAVPYPYYGYGYGIGRPFFFPFFPLGGILFFFGLLFLLSFVFRGFRGRGWHRYGGGYYGGQGPWGPGPNQPQGAPGQPGPNPEGPQNPPK